MLLNWDFTLVVLRAHEMRNAKFQPNLWGNIRLCALRLLARLLR